MENIQELTTHVEQHRELIDQFEQITVMLNQLTEGCYQSLEVYMNNCCHLRDKINEAKALMFSRSFEQYLLRHDAVLYYSLQSVVIAVGITKNMLDNLNGCLKRGLNR